MGLPDASWCVWTYRPRRGVLETGLGAAGEVEAARVDEVDGDLSLSRTKTEDELLLLLRLLRLLLLDEVVVVVAGVVGALVPR